MYLLKPPFSQLPASGNDNDVGDEGEGGSSSW